MKATTFGNYFFQIKNFTRFGPVSYTHLDVYKRQMFGCDICQDVCPWNRFSAPTLEEKFKPNAHLKSFHKEDWKEITQELFSEIFRKSPVKRTKFAGLQLSLIHI